MKSNAWQLAFVIIVLLVALFIAMDIDHPEWVRNLFSRRWSEPREIALLTSLDLKGGHHVWLTADAPVSQEELEETRNLIELRIRAQSLVRPRVELEDDGRIFIHVPDTWQTRRMTDTIQATALIEFVAVEGEEPSALTVVETTGVEEVSEPGDDSPFTSPPIVPAGPVTSTEESTSLPLSEPVAATEPLTSTEPLTPTEPLTITELLTATGPVTITAPITPTEPLTTTQPIPGYDIGADPITTTEPATPTARVYETILSNRDLWGVALTPNPEAEPGSSLDYVVAFAFSDQGSTRFESHVRANPARLFCIVLDKQVVACARLPMEEVEVRAGQQWSIKTGLDEENAERIAATLKYVPFGQLTIPLHVDEAAPAEPELGEAAVSQGARAAIIGLCSLALLALLYHRLAGLLTILGLAAYGLICVALLKVIPLPLTLPGLVAFIAAGLLTLGAHFSTFEHLRAQARNTGQVTSKLIEASYRRAWPATRDLHLLTLAVALVVWYLGWFLSNQAVQPDPAIHPMGATLTTCTLASLFVARFVARSLGRLVLGLSEKSVNKHGWILGI